MELAEELEQKGLGVEIRDHWRGTCLFAENIVLMARISNELQEMRNVVATLRELGK